jgi:lysophospholipase L1-like esterase
MMNETNDQMTIILLGDSIMKNDSYVPESKTIVTLLKQKLNNNSKIYNFAEDGSTINDVYQQLGFVPMYLNTPSTTIFLSIGGNDIISDYFLQEKNPQDITWINKKFQHYKKLVETIQKKMDKTTIVLLDVYYPHHYSFKNYLHLIKEWNRLLNSQYNTETILSISNCMKNQDDFINSIEPSGTGGEKIVNAILLKLDA